ncbi:hypothetical protein [Nesterenkonia haasae]|uniref:hypothetical protein n=1 Tax=Nesterenkonia haasae TaxID=2587813 RepID=UPI001390EEAA|nr:hypothetical protein [Nesterenkonia haasae]
MKENTMPVSPSSITANAAAVRRARRRLATIVVEGLGAVGFRLAEHLVECRIGTLVLRDERPVGLRDRGFRSLDAGRPRAEAAAELLAAKAEETAVVEAPAESSISGADLHVLAFRGRVPAAALHRGLEESPAVLAVLAAESGWRIGPLLLQDSLVCSDCMGVGWLPAEVPAGGAETLGPLEEAAAALAAHQITVLIEGMATAAVHSGGLMTDAATGDVSHVRPRPGRDCTCPYVNGESSEEGLVGL